MDIALVIIGFIFYPHRYFGQLSARVARSAFKLGGLAVALPHQGRTNGYDLIDHYGHNRFGGYCAGLCDPCCGHQKIWGQQGRYMGQYHWFVGRHIFPHFRSFRHYYLAFCRGFGWGAFPKQRPKKSLESCFWFFYRFFDRNLFKVYDCRYLRRAFYLENR